MSLDPAFATVIVAAITGTFAWLGIRAQREGKIREVTLNEQKSKQDARDKSFEYMERSRDAAIEDVARLEQELAEVESWLGECVQVITALEQTVPPRPRKGALKK